MPWPGSGVPGVSVYFWVVVCGAVRGRVCFFDPLIFFVNFGIALLISFLCSFICVVIFDKTIISDKTVISVFCKGSAVFRRVEMSSSRCIGFIYGLGSLLRTRENGKKFSRISIIIVITHGRAIVPQGVCMV